MGIKMTEDAVYEVPFSMIEMKECEAYAPLPNRSQFFYNAYMLASWCFFSRFQCMHNYIVAYAFIQYTATSCELVFALVEC